jgi:hypothetical protein
VKTYTTKGGTVLPLTNIKGKDYLPVAQRLQWFNEENLSFNIQTSLVTVDNEQTIARAHITVMDPDGRTVRSATATKRETVDGFPDHTEKAETSAIGRALALLGYGTQFTAAELDEGDRLADSPQVIPISAKDGLSHSTSRFDGKIIPNAATVTPGTSDMFKGWND